MVLVTLLHPSFVGEGVDRSNVSVEGFVDTGSKNIGHFLHYHTDVPPVTTNIKQSASQLSLLLG